MRNFKVVINIKILGSSINFNEKMYPSRGKKVTCFIFAYQLRQEMLSNFNFYWTKTLYQNDLKHIAFL